MTPDDVVDILSIPLIGIVPDDENVVIATNQGEPLVGEQHAGRTSLSEYLPQSPGKGSAIPGSGTSGLLVGKVYRNLS